MRTKEEYFENLKRMKKNIYVGGEVVGRDDLPGMDVVGLTFDMAAHPEHERLMTATSHLSGEKINRFNHVHQSVDDLLAKQEMTRVICRACGGCIQRCMGTDATNALSVVTYECDQAHGTEYNRRFLEFLKHWQEGDVVGCCAQSDVKGDRLLRPHQQRDPDLYLRIVDKKKDGIVVRGAKAHITMAPYAEEIIAIPTRMLTADEGDWAVAFAIPADTEGVRLITRAGKRREHPPELDVPAATGGQCDSLTVFDDVFVPWERVFLCGETEFGGRLALLFALYHRHSYTGCKPAVTDVLTGLAALAAEYNNIDRASHVQHSLAEMVSVAELVYGTGIAAAVKSHRAACGTQIPDVIFCNVARKHAGVNIYHEYNTVAELAGGLPATLPFDEEYLSPEVGDFVRKYIARREGVDAEDIYRCFRLIADVAVSALGGVKQFAGVHGGGSPVMEDIAIMKNYDIESRKAIAKYLAGIEPGPEFRQTYPGLVEH